MLTGRRFRVEFSDEQAEFAQRIGGACRALWNTGLEQRREYRRRGAWMNYARQAAELAQAKNEQPWLEDVPGHCLQQTLMDLDRACREHGTFRVHWRSSRRWAPSFRFPEGNKMLVEQLNRRHARVKLPKLGWVKFRCARSLNGATIRSATVSRDADQWFVSLLVDDGIQRPDCHAQPGTAVGVDRGVVVAIAASRGDLLNRRFVTVGEQQRRMALQRQLARTTTYSRNRNKIRTKLAGLRARERRRRQDFCAQTAHRLTVGHELVVLEALQIRNMTRRARPVEDPENPGQYLANGAASKSCLNNAILSKGWFRFETALMSASRYSGTQIVKVPAAFTSQRCSACGHVDPKSRESQAVFKCTHCFAPAQHADVNAAKNILAAGLAVTACREAQHRRCWRDSEAGTSRKPRGITAPTRLPGWNPPASATGRTSNAKQRHG
ncbi:transposase [Mycobacterium alsense]|uniref:Transposase n=1 Tax=Mycobacterium alsense TaxID=324058 RepID=A0ABX3RG17_9MYCO|nr:transposase [Mycobacterium alsense]OQZ92964.1 transposase [Mycobacterium alsense]